MHNTKVALVTGANRGIGLEIARQLGKQGLTVVLSARDQQKADKAAETLKKEGIDAYGVALEVTSEKDVAKLPEFFSKKFGRLDVLVNNAGVLLDRNGPVTADTLRKTYEANTIAPYAITDALLPLIKKSPAGRIVNQSSILGSQKANSDVDMIGTDWLSPAYNSSKAALNTLTIILARQLDGTNVKVNASHPGWVKTDMGGEGAQLEIEDGAKTAVRLATLPDNGPTGGYFHMNDQLPW